MEQVKFHHEIQTKGNTSKENHKNLSSEFSIKRQVL